MSSIFIIDKIKHRGWFVDLLISIISKRFPFGFSNFPTSQLFVFCILWYIQAIWCYIFFLEWGLRAILLDNPYFRNIILYYSLFGNHPLLFFYPLLTVRSHGIILVSMNWNPISVLRVPLLNHFHVISDSFTFFSLCLFLLFVGLQISSFLSFSESFDHNNVSLGSILRLFLKFIDRQTSSFFKTVGLFLFTKTRVEFKILSSVDPGFCLRIRGFIFH